MSRSVADFLLLVASGALAVGLIVVAAGLGPVWVPLWVAGRGINRVRCRRFAAASREAEPRRIGADDLGLRLSGAAGQAAEVLPYTRVAHAQWWLQIRADSGFASGEDSETHLLVLEEIDGRRRSFLVTPEPPNAILGEVLGPLIDRGKLAREPRDGGTRGVGLGPGLLVMLATCSWSAAGLMWSFRRFGADWGLAIIVGSGLGVSLGVLIAAVLFQATEPSR